MTLRIRPIDVSGMPLHKAKNSPATAYWYKRGKTREGNRTGDRTKEALGAAYPIHREAGREYHARTWARKFASPNFFRGPKQRDYIWRMLSPNTHERITAALKEWGVGFGPYFK